MLLSEFSSIQAVVSSDTRLGKLDPMFTMCGIENSSITEVTFWTNLTCCLLMFILISARVTSLFTDTTRRTAMSWGADILCRSLRFLATGTEKSRITIPRWQLKAFSITVMARQTRLTSRYIFIESGIGICSLRTFLWIVSSNRAKVAFGTNSPSNIISWVCNFSPLDTEIACITGARDFGQFGFLAIVS